MSRSKKARKCPRCSSRDILLQDSLDDGTDVYVCADCDLEFEIRGYASKRQDDAYEPDVELDPDMAEEGW